MPPVDKIVIGIDFGTTYSGVAWAEALIPNDIHSIRNWPGSEAGFDKVPSSMLYLDGTFRWGEEVQSMDGRLEFMKLLLDPSQERNSSLADPLGLAAVLEALPGNKVPVDAVADYLRGIKTYALEELTRNRGQNFETARKVEYRLTVPAVWSDSARALTLRAANQAGIGTSQDLILIPEPEAAALYCLTTLHNVLKAKDVFVVVDCGGGTVDLVSYEVITREPRLAVKEVAVGGGLCGSVFLNRRFEKMVRERLGFEFDTWLRRPRGKRHFQEMMRDFDSRLKRKFNGSDQDNLTEVLACGLPNNDAQGVADGYMLVSREDMQEIFEPVVKEILRLIQEQIDKVRVAGKLVSSIIMVGGFGSSAYLRKRVEKHANTQRDKLTSNFELIYPTDSWSAVVRGAVITGLQCVEIESRKARRNYGICYSTKFERSQHHRFSPFQHWDKHYECFFIGGLMRWCVRKGAEIKGTQKISIPFSSTFDNRHSDMEGNLTLYASDSVHAEEHLSHQNVYPVCTVDINMSPLRESLHELTNSKGKTFYYISFNIIMRIHSAQLSFGIESDDGEPCGATTTVTFI